MTSMTVNLPQGVWTVDALSDGIFRVVLRRNKRQRESMLTRYGIVQTDFGEDCAERKDTMLITGSASVQVDRGILTFRTSKYSLVLNVSETLGEEYEEEGFCFRVPLSKGERLFGLGDETREVLQKRGRMAEMWQANVSSYGPIPYLMGSSGWALMCNTTYRHSYDLGKSNPDEICVSCEHGRLDIYVFTGQSMKEALQLYTRAAGRPVMLPAAAYGLTVVCNEQESQRDVLENALMFRREKIPCDILGLEPGWMSKHYDYSTEKKWNEDLFYLPYWKPVDYYGSWFFPYNLRQMGFKLSLWLCCDYDLLWKEEKEEFERQENDMSGASINDTHLSGAIYADQLTKPGEEWFDHLKKFVDNGASCFKLDGANQVLQHPDRVFAGKYRDDEVHNVYPVIYGKQMKEGFQKYTGRRAMIYTPCMYAGQQQYCATWAGDTGGGPATMISILNLAMSGHSNASCDMDITQLSSIHYCMLMPWTQQLTWRNWNYPWFLGDELEDIYRTYAQMRSSLFPYIYSAAHVANETGLPVVRPLSLEFEGTDRFDSVLNEYMLGDGLLVAAFDMRLKLPSGRWTDCFTGRTLNGDAEVLYDPPRGRGGALLARDGAIVVTRAWEPHITHHVPNEYNVHVFPGGKGSFTLYEDDGETYAYEQGEIARTRFSLDNNVLRIGKREGSYQTYAEAGLREDNGVTFSSGCVKGEMPGICPLDLYIHNVSQDAEIRVNGEKVETEWLHGCLCVRIPAMLHASEEIECVFL